MINLAYIYNQTFINVFSICFRSGDFVDILKYADITPFFKTGDTTGKKIY